MAEGRVNIRYIYQENGGKQRAINRGVHSAKGDLFFIVDSDGKIEALRSGISKSGDEIRFTAVDYVYRESEFRKKYVNRVINPFLT